MKHAFGLMLFGCVLIVAGGLLVDFAALYATGTAMAAIGVFLALVWNANT